MRARFLGWHVTSVCGHLVSSLQLLYVHVARLFDFFFSSRMSPTLTLDQFCCSKGLALGGGCSWVRLLQLSTARSLYMHHVEPAYSISTLPVASLQLTVQLLETYIWF